MSDIWTQVFPPKATFSADDIPDQGGKVVIVTGGYSGIGKETVKALLRKNAKVYVAGRSEENARKAIEELKSETGKEAAFLHLDLGNLGSIRRSAEEFKRKETDLHILFNNGGVMWPPIDTVTDDGYDAQFGINTLGHFFFTILLLPTLLSTAEHSPDKQVRVVNTSSVGHTQAKGIQWDTLKDGPARRKLSAMDLYAQSKLGNVLFTKEIRKRYGDRGVISISLHPGHLKTDLARHIPAWQRFLMVYATGLFYPPSQGALTLLYAGTAKEAANLNGEYLYPWGRLGKTTAFGEDPQLARELWDWMEEQVDGH